MERATVREAIKTEGARQYVIVLQCDRDVQRSSACLAVPAVGTSALTPPATPASSSLSPLYSSLSLSLGTIEWTTFRISEETLHGIICRTDNDQIKIDELKEVRPV